MLEDAMDSLRDYPCKKNRGALKKFIQAQKYYFQKSEAMTPEEKAHGARLCDIASRVLDDSVRIMRLKEIEKNLRKMNKRK